MIIAIYVCGSALKLLYPIILNSIVPPYVLYVCLHAFNMKHILCKVYIFKLYTQYNYYIQKTLPMVHWGCDFIESFMNAH